MMPDRAEPLYELGDLYIFQQRYKAARDVLLPAIKFKFVIFDTIY